MTGTRQIARVPARRRPWADIVPGSVCIVTLVDRRTGCTLSVNGRRIAVYTRSPEIAAEELLGGRDPTDWDVRVQALDPARRRQ